MTVKQEAALGILKGMFYEGIWGHAEGAFPQNFYA